MFTIVFAIVFAITSALAPNENELQAIEDNLLVLATLSRALAALLTGNPETWET